ncbi:hypothetical protein D6201_10330 [Aurantiacibacter aquimixticola]|uniref:Terminase n=1 Tax=Aurantiacibacter aquimixticola TaxID=1958945 RepID=A0A419RV78_9SPHN|nr:hypothetical protein D6201_10330 [Aurantiacibacter aquimixticola]
MEDAVKKRVKARKDQKGQGLKQNWKFVFFETLAETSNVSEAARACDAQLSYVYKHRREDPDFRRRWSAALLEGYDHLEMETLQRLRFGIAQGDAKFDIPNALRLLAAHRASAEKERARQAKYDKDAVLDRLNTKLDRIWERQQARKAKAAAAQAAAPVGDPGDHPAA